MNTPKPCKILKTETGTINVYGNHHWKEIEYEYTEEGEPFFWYNSDKYFLNEFMRTNKGDLFHEHGYHGYLNSSMWTGNLIKFNSTVEAIKIYRYNCLG